MDNLSQSFLTKEVQMLINEIRNARVFIHCEAVDGRKAHNGLAAIVRDQMRFNLLAGDIFLFVSKSRKVGKALVFDGTGLLLIHKRLEEGRLMNFRHLGDTYEITFDQLCNILSGCRLVLGIDLSPS